jgi:uncharacterized protein (TIGR03083 family)
MARGAIEALRADREALLAIGARLSDDDWRAGSGCPGWSVQDVVAHMGTLFWAVVDPAALPDTTGLATEPAQDVCVEARRSWTAADVLADYESVSTEALERLAALESQDFELALGDLGTYPAFVLPNAFSFDHYTHIRADLFAPRGPLTDQPPPSDELRLTPALDWIEAALPQQNAGIFGSLTGTIEIAVCGPGARTIRLGSGEPMAHISSDAPSFVRWVTQRATWQELGVHAAGDERQLSMARTLRVF